MEVKRISIADIDRVQLRKFVDFCNQPPIELITHASYPFFVEDKQDGTLAPNPKWRPSCYVVQADMYVKHLPLKPSYRY
ncbi:hypothetical protein P4S73_13410 [Paraglaciecola sp. Hal342]